MKLKLFLFLCFIPFFLPAKELYHIRNLSEQEILKTYTVMLRDACRYAERDWTNASFSKNAGYWGDGVSAGNQGIRTVSGMVLANATLIKFDSQLSVADRKKLLALATAALRYITATHVTGPQTCPDGKHWGATERFGSESWQSGMWTGTFATGAWLIWNKLDAPLQHDLEQVIAHENDILSHRPPPNNLALDTKAEENGWEVPCLVLGELMFPDHPHAKIWHQTAVRYMMNTLCTEADTYDTNFVDGRAVNDWIKGANVQPDFTLENHNIFHPAYVACSSYFLTQAAMYYTYAHQPVPAAATHHLRDTWRMFETIFLPWGEVAYPQSMDWELHSLPYINLFAALATSQKDAFAARMEQNSLQYLREWQVMSNGDLETPGSRLGITRHAVNAEQLSYAFLAHQVFGPATPGLSASAANAQEKGVWEYPYVGFIEHRTAKKFVSVSWKNRVMSLLMPIGDHEDNPEFTVPITDGLFGTFELSPMGSTVSKVIEHSWRKTSDGFDTAGILLLNGGRLKQRVRVISRGEQTVIYEDVVTAVSNVTVRIEKGIPLGIENDQISGGSRTLHERNGSTIFKWHQVFPAKTIEGNWANIDDRLGVVALQGSGMSYHQATGYTQGIAVGADILYASYSNQTRDFKAGEEVTRRVVIFSLESSASATRKLAVSCRSENQPGANWFYFTMPDETKAEISPLP